MHPPIRSNTDGKGDTYSALSALSFPDAVDKTRQEFLPESDILTVLRRVGVGPTGPLAFGEVDYDLDLMRAHERVAEAREAIDRLPPELLEHHGGPDAILRGVLDGSLETLSIPEPAPVDPPPPVVLPTTGLPTTPKA